MNINDNVVAQPLRSKQGGSERKQYSMQKELLGEYEEASHAWLARVKSEVELWTGLAQN